MATATVVPAELGGLGLYFLSKVQFPPAVPGDDDVDQGHVHGHGHRGAGRVRTFGVELLVQGQFPPTVPGDGLVTIYGHLVTIKHPIIVARSPKIGLFSSWFGDFPPFWSPKLPKW